MSDATYRRTSPNDDLYTPPEAFPAIVKWLGSSTFFHGPNLVWEPCSGGGHLSRYLKMHGYNVIESDIKDGLEWDFRHATPPDGIDCIVTNPPFSIRDQIIQRVLELRIPSALLMPTSTMNRRYMEHVNFRVFPVHGRVKFIGQKSMAPFDVSWFTFNNGGIL